MDIVVSPEATSVGGSEIVLTGSLVTLTAFQSLFGGNPLPSVSWTGPDGLPRSTSGRFDISVPGQITLMNITQDDNGTYTCIVSNGISPNLSQTVLLIVAG